MVGRSAADVERVEVVAEICGHAHLGAQVAEVGAGAVLLVEEAVEGAVRAQPLAERHVRVEHVARAGFGLREARRDRPAPSRGSCC